MENDVVFQRRSIRKYQARPVEPEKVERILRAGMQAPSACNQRPWEFFVVENREKIAALLRFRTTGEPIAITVPAAEAKASEPAGTEVEDAVIKGEGNAEQGADALDDDIRNADGMVSLAQYKARMKDGQKAIYYITSDTEAGARQSPHLEIFRKKGIEVLLLSDRVDEWMLSYLQEFDGTPLQSVARGGLDLGDLEDEAERKASEVTAADF